MFNGKYTDLDAVLVEIADYPFVEGLSKRELAHTLADLLKQTGASAPLLNTYKNIQIVNHKGLLPQDMVYVSGVKNLGNNCSNKGIPMIYSGNIYNSNLHDKAAIEQCQSAKKLTKEQVKSLYNYPVVADDVDLDNVNFYGGEKWYEMLYAPKLDELAIIPLEVESNAYAINGMSIDTSFKNGWVKIAYQSMPMGKDNYPMVPDTPSFRQALKYASLRKGVEPAFLRGDVTRAVYNEIMTQYSFYIGQASNEFRILSEDQMQHMYNSLIRIIPDEFSHRSGGSSSTKREQ